jgi:hypothetical protein
MGANIFLETHDSALQAGQQHSSGVGTSSAAKLSKCLEFLTWKVFFPSFPFLKVEDGVSGQP